MTTQQNSQLTLKSIARIKQIKTALEQSNEVEQLVKEEEGKIPQILQIKFLEERIELYNEKAMLESDLVHTGAQKPSDEEAEQILQLAEQLDLANMLHNDHSATGELKSCWTNCENCITDCTECVTGCTECVTGCTECVSSCTDSVSGSDCIAGTLLSACQPNPGF